MLFIPRSEFNVHRMEHMRRVEGLPPDPALQRMIDEAVAIRMSKMKRRELPDPHQELRHELWEIVQSENELGHRTDAQRDQWWEENKRWTNQRKRDAYIGNVSMSSVLSQLPPLVPPTPPVRPLMPPPSSIPTTVERELEKLRRDNEALRKLQQQTGDGTKRTAPPAADTSRSESDQESSRPRRSHRPSRPQAAQVQYGHRYGDGTRCTGRH